MPSSQSALEHGHVPRVLFRKLALPWVVPESPVGPATSRPQCRHEALPARSTRGQATVRRRGDPGEPRSRAGTERHRSAATRCRRHPRSPAPLAARCSARGRRSEGHHLERSGQGGPGQRCPWRPPPTRRRTRTAISGPATLNGERSNPGQTSPACTSSRAPPATQTVGSGMPASTGMPPRPRGLRHHPWVVDHRPRQRSSSFSAVARRAHSMDAIVRSVVHRCSDSSPPTPARFSA